MPFADSPNPVFPRSLPDVQSPLDEKELERLSKIFAPSAPETRPERVRAPRPEDEGMTSADFVLRAMLSPSRWWGDVIAAEATARSSVEAAGMRASASKKKRIRRSLGANMANWTTGERHRIATILQECPRYVVPVQFVRQTVEDGVFRDPDRLSRLLNGSRLDVPALWIECDILDPSEGEGGRSGFLVERLDPDVGATWVIMPFFVRDNGVVEASCFVTIVDTTGAFVETVNDPYEIISGRLQGIPSSFVYSGLGQVVPDRAIPAFRIPEGREGSMAISPSPLYTLAVGNLRNDVKARAGEGYVYDSGFVSSIYRKAGHLQCILPLLFLMNGGRYDTVDIPSPTGRLDCRLFHPKESVVDCLPAVEEPDVEWTTDVVPKLKTAMPPIGFLAPEEEPAAPHRSWRDLPILRHFTGGGAN